MVSVNCKFSFIKSKDKSRYNPDELREVEKRAMEFWKTLATAGAKHKDIESEATRLGARARAIADHVSSLDMVDVVNLTGSLGKISKFWANQLGLRANFLGMSPFFDYTKAGRLQENFVDAQAVGQGMVEEFAKFGTVNAIKKLSDEMNGLFALHRINDKRALNALKLEALDVGFIPKARIVTRGSEAVDAVLDQRRTLFTEKMRRYGFLGSEIDSIINTATKIQVRNDEIRAVANSLGIDKGIGSIGGVGQTFRPEVKKFIREWSDAKKAFPDSWNKINYLQELSKKSVTYTVNDEVITAYQLGISMDELRYLMESGTLAKHIAKNIEPALLENMLDVGSLSKLPMTTKEVYEMVVKELGEELPFKGLDEMFIVDPAEATKYMADNMINAARKSNMARLIVGQGLENGWGVTATQYLENPALYKDYKLVEKTTLNRWFDDYSGQDIYIRKDVFDVWDTQLAIAGDPIKFNALVQNLQYWGSFFNQARLLSVAFPVRVILDTFRNYSAAGGNLLRYHEGWSDLLRIQRNGLDALDDTKAVYKGLDGGMVTERKLFESFVELRNVGVAPFVASEAIPLYNNLKGLFRFDKSVNYVMWYMKAYGGLEGSFKTGKEALDYVKRLQGSIFQNIAAPASFFEASSKWSLIKSLADTTRANKFGQVASGMGTTVKDFNNLRDIFRHVDDYFPNWNNPGGLANFLSFTFKPFASFAMQNPPAQVRQALRRPIEFINYWRIQGLINQALDDEDLNEATVPDYMMKTPIAVHKDKESGEWIFLLPSSWDARKDAWQSITEAGESAARMSGQYVGTTKEQVDMLTGRDGTFQFFKEFFGQSATPITRALEVLFNEKFDTGGRVYDDTGTKIRILLCSPWMD